MTTPVIFAADDHDFARLLADQLLWPLGRFYQQTFSDGNLFVRLDTPVKDRPVVIVQTLYGPQLATRLWRVLFLVDAAVRAGSSRCVLVVPFFSYGKADRVEEVGCSLRAQVVADCLSTVGVSDVITLDWHQPHLSRFFAVPTYNLDPTPLWVEYCRGQQLTAAVVVAADAGASTRAQALAQQWAAPMIVGHKTRPDHREKPRLHLPATDWTGRTAIVVDDFTTSGGTLMACAGELVRSGCQHIWVCVSHVPLTASGWQLLCHSSIERLVTTNTTTIPADADVTVLDASPLFARQLRQLVG